MKLLILVFVVAGTRELFVDAMHGGQTGFIEHVPYMASIFLNYDDGGINFSCGASILSEQWILTAAHCTKTSDDVLYIQVRVKGQKTMTLDEDDHAEFHNVTKIVPYLNYSTETRWKGDISLIQLSEPIKFDEKSQPIAIAKRAPRVNDVVTVSGYGFDYGEYVESLKVGKQKVISRRGCREAYKNAPQGNITIDDRVFCADASMLDLCFGDSGSPAVINGKVVGVAAEGCESPLPDIFVNVAHYYDWIVQVTGIEFE